MPVTTSTHVTAFDTGFRAWVTVTNNGTALAGGTITVDVKLSWDATKANYVAPDPDSPTPTFMSAGLGFAVWTGQTLATGASQEYGVILQCAFGERGSVVVNGTAVDTPNKQRDSSSATWSCGGGGGGGASA